ncbi:hypothetical protein SEUCBS139899_007663 [Sporothrix eucalyptigena]
MASNTFKEPKYGLSLTGKLSLVMYLAFLVVPNALVNTARSVFTALRRGVPVRMYITAAVLGASLGGLTPRQLQYVTNTSIHAYRAWMKSMVAKAQKRGQTNLLASLQSEIQPLPDGRSSILWMGNRKTATKFVLFFHGGGYVAPLLEGHLEWCWRVFVQPFVGTQNEVAVAILDYTLCPDAQFPTQLKQAVAAMEALSGTGIKPQQILIGGDSAGGNLTAHLLHHIAHPDSGSDSGVTPLHIAEPLLGAFLVSPWISADVSQRSFVENHGIDMLTAKHITDASRSFYGAGIYKTDMLREAYAVFDGMESVVSDVLVTAGQQEVLRDQAVILVDRLRNLNPNLKTKFEVANDEGHDFILLEGGDRWTGPAMERMRAWATELIQGA